MKFKKRGVYFYIFFILIILTIITFLYDVQIIKFIASLRNDFFDYTLLSIAFASNVFIIFFFLTTLFLWKERKRRWILPLWLAGFISFIVSYIIKIGIHRPRPFQTKIVSVLGIIFNFIKDNFNTWNFSFPSFQAMLVFSAVPLLNKEFKKFKYIWFIFACLVAFSRVYFGVHYLSDVLAGSIIGYFIGILMVKLEEKYALGKELTKKFKLSN